MLFVGLGGGVALELAPRTYTSLDVIELEPEVLRANRQIGDLRARDPLSDPRVDLHGRRLRLERDEHTPKRDWQRL